MRRRHLNGGKKGFLTYSPSEYITDKEEIFYGCQKQGYVLIIMDRCVDGVGPVDNRPSTN